MTHVSELRQNWIEKINRTREILDKCDEKRDVLSMSYKWQQTMQDLRALRNMARLRHQ